MKNMMPAKKVASKFAVAWGHTSTWFAWSDYVLTLSDHASADPLNDLSEFVDMWQGQRLVFRTHGAAFHDSKPWLLSDISVTPRLTRVGRSSFQFECDLHASDEALVATTRGTCVYLDKSLTTSTTLPSEVRSAIVDRLERPNLTFDALLNSAQVSLQKSSLQENMDDSMLLRDTDAAWNSRVRVSECDALGHVNNAKWALLVADALRAASSSVLRAGTPKLLHLDYLKPAFPGDMIRASVALAPIQNSDYSTIAARVDLARYSTDTSFETNKEVQVADGEVCVSAILVLPVSSYTPHRVL